MNMSVELFTYSHVLIRSTTYYSLVLIKTMDVLLVELTMVFGEHSYHHLLIVVVIVIIQFMTSCCCCCSASSSCCC